MRNFFRATTILLFAFALALAGCGKEEQKNASPIFGCVVETKASPVPIYSDAGGNGRADLELPLFTKLSVVEQSGNMLNVEFGDGGSKKSGWVPLDEVTLNAEIFDRTVDLALGGDENARLLFGRGFPRFTNGEAVARLTPILGKLGGRLKSADRHEENDKGIFLVLQGFRDTKCSPNETNPLHLLIPYANGELLDWFDRHEMDVPDGDGRSCLMLAVKAENIEAARYFYGRYKKQNYCGLDHRDNAGRTIVDYIDGCGNAEIRELLALCRYDVQSLVGRCVEHLARTQEERELALAESGRTAEDSGSVMLTQREFPDGAEAVVVRESELFLPDGTKTTLKPLDTVEIVGLLSDRGGAQPYNSLFEYELPDDGRFFSRCNFYLARCRDKVGIVGGSALAHERLRAVGHFGGPPETDSVELYVGYKYRKSVYGDEKSHYAELFEHDLNGGGMRKLETGSSESSFPLDGKAPVYLGGQESLCNFSLAQFYRFEAGGSPFYFCALSFNPYPDDGNRSLYHFYAVRGDGAAFLLGTHGNSEYVRNCAEVNSSFYSELDEKTALPELSVYEYGWRSRNLETGEKEEPFTVTERFKFDAESMRFVETGVEFADSLPEF